jgi:hypothetical protein
MEWLKAKLQSWGWIKKPEEDIESIVSEEKFEIPPEMPPEDPDTTKKQDILNPAFERKKLDKFYIENSSDLPPGYIHIQVRYVRYAEEDNLSARILNNLGEDNVLESNHEIIKNAELNLQESIIYLGKSTKLAKAGLENAVENINTLEKAGISIESDEVINTIGKILYHEQNLKNILDKFDEKSINTLKDELKGIYFDLHISITNAREKTEESTNEINYAPAKLELQYANAMNNSIELLSKLILAKQYLTTPEIKTGSPEKEIMFARNQIEIGIDILHKIDLEKGNIYSTISNNFNEIFIELNKKAETSSKAINEQYKDILVANQGLL